MAKHTADEIMDGLKELHNAVAFQFNLVDKRSRELETRILAEMNRRFDRVYERFDGMDARFDGVDARFDKVEAALAELKGLIVSEPKRRKR
jgi:hypothetical protein